MNLNTAQPTAMTTDRRQFLGRGATLSAAALALLAGRDALAANHKGNPAKDVDILNVALGLEHEAINAYQLGAGSGLLQKPVLDVAVQFQGHHKVHRDALIATIQKLGGKPVAEMKLEDYAKALNAAALKNQGDVPMRSRHCSWVTSLTCTARWRAAETANARAAAELLEAAAASDASSARPPSTRPARVWTTVS